MLSAMDRRLLKAIGMLARRPAAERIWVVERLTIRQRRALAEYWPAWAHKGQAEPEGDWQTWVLMAGRGFGKTRAGAEWVSALARHYGPIRIALVGATIEDARKVMVEGESGIIAVAGTGEALRWMPSQRRLLFPGGAEATVYSGTDPEKLRGPQHHFAWCDEIAKWRYPDASWSNLQLGLRLGERPRVLVTTTPKPIKLLKALTGSGALTRGRTHDNPHLPDAFRRKMIADYEGTRLGRQELDGELIEDFEGALWTRDMIEAARAEALPELRRVVIGVDPPGSAEGDACGIVVAALGEDGVGYVLGEHSVRGLSPEGWARAVAAAAEAHGADRVIAEKNMGGDMVEATLRAADAGLPVKLVSASRGKTARAEPVLVLFERGKAKLAGRFPELEDEMAGMTFGGDYHGPGNSPDRADAMVWALTELMLRKAKAPRIRGL